MIPNISSHRFKPEFSNGIPAFLSVTLPRAKEFKFWGGAHGKQILYPSGFKPVQELPGPGRAEGKNPVQFDLPDSSAIMAPLILMSMSSQKRSDHSVRAAYIDNNMSHLPLHPESGC